MQTTDAAPAIIPLPDKPAGQLDFSPRESAEMVVGFSGAIGCGMNFAVDAARRLLEGFGYAVVHVKLSQFIEGLLTKKLVQNWDIKYDSRNRYERLQLAGNKLRNTRSADFLAELAIAAISNDRVEREAAKPENKGVDVAVDAIVPGRVAYLVDQLKHPQEVRLLRRVYGNLFYLVGVLASEGQRTENLRKKNIAGGEVGPIIERDKQDEEEHGQQLDKTLRLADFFLRNNRHSDKSIEKPLRRFFSLVHGETARTPTKDEYAMYAAFSAGLRSACLSRQVGAAITDSSGNVLATGCNDVPKARGGLYTEDDGDLDYRCINLRGGVCFNDQKKDELEAEIQSILTAKNIELPRAKELARDIRRKTRLRDLLEFSRSVHAEMDAIVSIVRKGGNGVIGGCLFTTTFPCHNCARHIVAAGISKVFYIEPYEKSLALELHHDAIAADSEDGEGRVRFMHFEGVAPRKYQDLFYSVSERKSSKGATRVKVQEARKSPVQYLDSYRDLESKVVQNLVTQGLSESVIVELATPAVA